MARSIKVAYNRIPCAFARTRLQSHAHKPSQPSCSRDLPMCFGGAERCRATHSSSSFSWCRGTLCSLEGFWKRCATGRASRRPWFVSSCTRRTKCSSPDTQTDSEATPLCSCASIYTAAKAWQAATKATLESLSTFLRIWSPVQWYMAAAHFCQHLTATAYKQVQGLHELRASLTFALTPSLMRRPSFFH